MLPTPRTQPYRAGVPREINAALQAMLLGRQPGVVNEGDFARQRSQMQANGGVRAPGPQETSNHLHDLALQHLQEMQRQHLPKRPMATADARGLFGSPGGEPHWQGLEELLAGLMGGPGRRAPAPMVGAPVGAVGPRY